MQPVRHYPLATSHYPLFSNPQSLIPSARRGISLLEVLVSIGILSIGLTSVAMIIPVGKLAISATNRSDRTGACGRAGLRDVKVRGMLDNSHWLTMGGGAYTPSNASVVIDPLGATNGLTGLMGTVRRITLQVGAIPLTSAGGVPARNLADSMFVWQDDLVFTLPEEDKSGSHPAGSRPFVPIGIGNVASQGKFSWFLTVTPQVIQGVRTGTYNVAVVVCMGRQTTSVEPTCQANALGGGNPLIAYGGGAVVLTPMSGQTVNVKENDWIMLCNNTGTQAQWYRVANAAPPDGVTQTLCLVGPDWVNNGNPVTAVIIDRVTGVYATTVQVN